MKITFADLLPPLRHTAQALTASAYEKHDAVLQITAAAAAAAPYDALFAALRKRRRSTSAPLLCTLPGGTLLCRAHLTAQDSAFERQCKIRAALAPLLAVQPRKLAVDNRLKDDAAHIAYAVLVATAKLPGNTGAAPPRVHLAGTGATLAPEVCAARANTLTRALTAMPPNVLTPSAFAKFAVQCAKQSGIAHEVLTLPQLKRLNAGAIAAVGRAEGGESPRLVRLSYQPRGKHKVALVGKGVCYDTGGVNVKPARYMRGMGADMAGAAVALASVLAAAELKLPHSVDAWLILAENNIAANAYRPDEVVTAANGKRIEVVHSDAEGRMLLADTLTLAARRKPQVVISYATLTGTMHMALGEGMSGFFSTEAAWRQRAEVAAEASGERLCYFPQWADYRDKLKSSVADIKQCSEEVEADHILATLFLREFLPPQLPWLHLDLSAAVNKQGLAAAPGGASGFGTSWTLSLLRQWRQAAKK